MNHNLTIGKENTVLLKYTLPMFVGVAFQQFYNIADSVIAGRFAGEDALAAVGASYAITMLFMAVAVGSQIGCTVIVSRLYGAGDYEAMKTSISTVLIACGVLSVILTIFGLGTGRLFLRLLKTPENIESDSALYLNIYIGGFIFLFLYNVTTGIFNSMGDSKTPLYLLIFSSISNILLDLLFVAVFHWNVAGVAWATFIAQSAAAIISLCLLIHRLKSINTKGQVPLFSFRLLGQICKIAVPSILQQSFISVGNLFIQQLVNGYGSSVVAGYSAAIKLNTFAITGFSTLGNGVSGFTSQNLGAEKPDRIKNGWHSGLIIALAFAVIFFILYFVFGKYCLYIFMDRKNSKNAIHTGVKFLQIVSPFYMIVCVKLICDGVLRGSSRMGLFMATTFTDLILRVLLAFLLSPIFGSDGIWFSWPIGWTTSMIISLLFCILTIKKIKTYFKI